MSQKISQALKIFGSCIKRINPEMENKSLTVSELKEAFFSLKTNKGTGYDDISFNIVKNCVGE